MDTSLSIDHYLEELSSSAPTPGGGNVSAFCGTLATSLGLMVCNLTIGKKKYLDSEVEIKVIMRKLEKAGTDFLILSEDDNKAFNQVMEAFKLPKETEAQKSARAKKIEAATIAAGVVPYRVIYLCKSIIRLIMTIAEKGNQNSLSDAGVAVSLILTAAQGAYLNVLINCTAYKESAGAKDILDRSEGDIKEVKEKCREGLELIEKKLKENKAT
ncbi:MAG: cyclodeaminase/cyclohydrolase family protein [Ignavibacteriaceae bacterium]|nr:cyclodeaminase/cyclohydrolase family protein [Ignavibacteriaceae bacterium]